LKEWTEEPAGAGVQAPAKARPKSAEAAAPAPGQSLDWGLPQAEQPGDGRKKK